ncbi:phosphoglycerate mutase-like protein [Obba rivulosa]|uniref:Phosphoglycerate mutase-like protein n=1 Tax=Obba rivulosa TaxID=1052685 RepID=A0A8E2AUZ4_9APHY|nr:phosphoglycerate mutase-like protein [Obba rivulosa]
MSHRDILGVVVLARNGDRSEFYQDPKDYSYGRTTATPLGEAQSHILGSFLRQEYLSPESSSYISTMRSELVDLNQVHVRVKVGGEGSAVFDSATALLQGLFPPTPLNKIELANETTIMAPLGGYQYVPVETVEPSNDRSLESWTDCPNFQKHIKSVLSSEAFKDMAKKAQPFLNDVRDYVWGRPVTLENAYNIWDYVNSELVHNRTFAHRLPPTFIEQARGLANFHENLVFSDKEMAGIGNIASRTALSSVLGALQRIAFNGDPLQFMLIETTYQPFISLFHQTEIVKQHPELQAIPDYGSAFAIELRRAAPPDARDFLRFKFRNGTEGAFRTLHVFNHHEDIPLTEFIYRLENSVVQSNSEWASACGSDVWALPAATSVSSGNRTVDAVCGASLAFLLVLLAWFITKAVQRVFMRRNYVRLQGQEELPQVVVVEKSPATYRD